MNKIHEDLKFTLLKVKNSFVFLNQKTVFITGGTGFFGKWLLESFNFANLNGYNINIIVLSRNPNDFKKRYPHLTTNIRFVQGDIKNFELDCPVDYVIHAATTASAQMIKDQPELMFQTIIEGTKKILEFSKKNHVKKILNISSGAVYGDLATAELFTPENCLTEELRAKKTNCYGDGKREAEILGNEWSLRNNIDFVSARCFAFVGPHLPLDGAFAIGNFIADKLNQKEIHLLGDGSPYRSYLYAGDLVIWLLTILTHGTTRTEYNVGSDQAFTIREIADFVNAYENDDSKSVTPIPTGGSRYIPSIRKAKNELGLSVYTNLDDSIKKTIEWYR